MAAQPVGLVSLEQIQIPPDVCGQVNSIWIRYVWRGKLLRQETEKKFADLKIFEYDEQHLSLNLLVIFCIILNKQTE